MRRCLTYKQVLDGHVREALTEGDGERLQAMAERHKVDGVVGQLVPIQLQRFKTVIVLGCQALHNPATERGKGI